MNLKTFLIIVNFCCVSVRIHAEEGQQSIISLLQKYRRPVTVLEIANHVSEKTFQRASYCKGSYILMLGNRCMRAIEGVEKRSIRNMVVLYPPRVDYTLLDNLGKCEHFDVVIIRDIEKWSISGLLLTNLRAALLLGDHIFIEVPQASREVVQSMSPTRVETNEVSQKVLMYFEVNKKCLKKARWTMRGENAHNYEIVSNFDEKRMYKRSTKTVSDWIPGINLVTFLMLRGAYPHDELIRKQLESFKNIQHNDLVVGNIVVQGRHIRPIDFSDARRNISPSVCVRAALKTIMVGKSRLTQDPAYLLMQYSKYLQAHKRKVRY